MTARDRKITNIVASVRARLLNLAKQSGRDFNAVLLQYFQERFLYRLSQSPHKDQLILKGALLFLIHDISSYRPTKDMDFLGVFKTDDLRALRNIITDIVNIPTDDGVKYDTETLRIERIAEESEHGGFRIKLNARLGTVRKVFQLDVGTGDEVVPKPVEMDFPTLLPGPAPRIQVYSKESMIAEKFEAMVRFSYLTSRMKDFYDILFMAQHCTFQLRILQKAIHTTFRNRNTPLEDRKIIFESEFKAQKDKQEQWTAFLARNHLHFYEHFSDVVDHLKAFIEPVCVSISDEGKNVKWQPAHWIWK